MFVRISSLFIVLAVTFQTAVAVAVDETDSQDTAQEAANAEEADEKPATDNVVAPATAAAPTTTEASAEEPPARIPVPGNGDWEYTFHNDPNKLFCKEAFAALIKAGQDVNKYDCGNLAGHGNIHVFTKQVSGGVVVWYVNPRYKRPFGAGLAKRLSDSAIGQFSDEELFNILLQNAANARRLSSETTEDKSAEDMNLVRLSYE